MSLANSDRLQESLERVVGLLVPRLRAELAFYAGWEMTVIAATPPAPPGVPPAPAVFLVPASVECAPIDPTIAALLPPMVLIPLRPGPDGGVSVPTPGSTVIVAFANGDPGKPYIHSLDPSIMPAVSLVQQLKIFCLPSGMPLAPSSLAGAAATLLTALETLG